MISWNSLSWEIWGSPLEGLATCHLPDLVCRVQVDEQAERFRFFWEYADDPTKEQTIPFAPLEVCLAELFVGIAGGSIKLWWRWSIMPWLSAKATICSLHKGNSHVSIIVLRSCSQKWDGSHGRRKTLLLLLGSWYHKENCTLGVCGKISHAVRVHWESFKLYTICGRVNDE